MLDAEMIEKNTFLCLTFPNRFSMPTVYLFKKTVRNSLGKITDLNLVNTILNERQILLHML